MSAIVDEEVSYTWYCGDCVVGGGPSDDDMLIEIQANDHNAEHRGGTP